MSIGTLDEKRSVWICEVAAREWYSVQDVCQILGTTGPSVYGAIKRGTMTAYKVGGVTRVKHEDLIDYVARRSVSEYAVRSADDLIEKILPDTTDTTVAKFAKAVAAEAPPSQVGIKLDIFDDDDDETIEEISEG